jgi:hypothetical protein
MSLTHALPEMTAAAPAETLPDTKHQGGGFEKSVSVVVSGPSLCDEDHIRESSFKSANVAKTYGHYLVRYIPGPVTTTKKKKQKKQQQVSWETMLIGGKETLGLQLKPKRDGCDYGRRVRQQTLAFSVVIKPDGVALADASQRFSPAECAKIFFIGCRSCREKHHIVPLGIDLKEYSVDSSGQHQSFTIGLTSAWADFVNDHAAAVKQDAKMRPPAEPRRWFPAVLSEKTATGEMVTQGPQIGTVDLRKDFGDKPMAIYRADERFALPANYDTLSILLKYRHSHDTTKVLKELGAVQLDATRFRLRKPDTETHTAPNVLSLKYTTGFAQRNGGASRAIIDAHSCSKTGARLEENNYWLCQSAELEAMLAQMRDEFTKEALAMNFDDGLTMTFHQNRPCRDWAHIRVVIGITYIVI